MGTRLWNSFKTMSETNNYINTFINGDMSIEYSYDSTINFTINGSIITNILELNSENTNNIFVFNNNDQSSLVILMNQYEKEHGQLGAFIAPFDKKACMQSLENSGKYI